MKTRRTKRRPLKSDLATAVAALTQQIAALEKLVKELANRPPIYVPYVVNPAPYVPPTPISPGDWPIAPVPGVVPITPTCPPPGYVPWTPSWSQPSITCKADSLSARAGDDR